MLYLTAATTRLTNANFGSDGGDFLAATLTRGIPHPTGYPTYILLGNLFQSLPISTPVLRAGLESLIPAALGAGLLTGWVCFVTGAKSPATLGAAVVTGTAWGAAPLLFSQAVIVEVHGLQSLIVVLVLWWISLNLDFVARRYEKWMLGLSVLFGLGFGNHITILLLVPAGLLAVIYSIRRSNSWRMALAQISLVMAGLLVYIYLPLRAQAYPAINWGNPQSWKGFIWEISANPYQGLLFGTETPVLWERIRSVARLLSDQFGVLGLVAGAIGVIQYSFRIKALRWSLIWIFVVYLAFAIGYKTHDSVGYLLPAVMVFAIWIGLSVPIIWAVKWRHIPIGIFLVVALTASMWLRVPNTRNRVDPRAQDQPARYAEALLKDAPRNSIIYTTTDQDTFPLWYYHFGMHERPDLRVIVLPLTQFVWYQQTMVHTYPDLKFPMIYTQDLPNDDWGKAISDLNPAWVVCRTQLTSETETGVAYQCSSQ